MKRNIIFILIALVVSAGLLAQPGGKRGPNGYERGMRGLDLTEEQQAKIGDMRLQMQKEMVKSKADMAALEAELKLALTADKFDEARLKQLNSKLSDLRAAMRLKHLLHQRSVRNLLTPEQQKKFDMRLLSGRGHGMGHGMRGEHRGMRGAHGEGYQRGERRMKRDWNSMEQEEQSEEGTSEDTSEI